MNYFSDFSVHFAILNLYYGNPFENVPQLRVTISYESQLQTVNKILSKLNSIHLIVLAVHIDKLTHPALSSKI